MDRNEIHKEYLPHCLSWPLKWKKQRRLSSDADVEAEMTMVSRDGADDGLVSPLLASTAARWKKTKALKEIPAAAVKEESV